MRWVPRSFARCLREGSAAIDVGRARSQWHGYVELLSQLGVPIDATSADEALPDCCFVEDNAVLGNAVAVLTNSATEQRRGETAKIGRLLEADYEVRELTGSAVFLDGGDVLRVGRQLFVGRSARTNDAGIAALRECLADDDLEVTAVDVVRGLHLKSSVTLLDPGRVLCVADAVDTEPLRRAGLECVAAVERHGANVLALGRSVVVSAAAPRTAQLVRDLGFQAFELPLSEFHSGDGGLTCLSLRIPPLGCWCV